MLEILQAPDHLAAFRLSGRVTGVDYDQMIAELEERLRRHPRVAVYADLTQLKRLTRDAFKSDFQYLLSKRNELHRFTRMVILSDKLWPSVLAHVAGAWLPFEIRRFKSAAREEALRWAAEPRAALPALRLISTTRPDTYAYVWNGKITRADVEHVLGTLRHELETHISVRVLGRIEHIGGFQPTALLQSSLMRVKLLGVRKIERYAVVGGPKWLPQYVALMKKITDIDFRYFGFANEREAWNWLEARPLGEPGMLDRTAPANSIN
ncbi:MAG TPA: STAS/SEC14 domain-containing protein [Polyangiales bacterium]|nr:STAS/SEC14 domain-containing protein [Polyangiales bacterium]